MLSIKPFPRSIAKEKMTKVIAKNLHVPLRELKIQEAETLIDWNYSNLDEMEEDCGE